MNFSRGHSGTKVRYVNRACFPKEKHQNSQKWAKFMKFSFWPFSLVWFAGATPDNKGHSENHHLNHNPIPHLKPSELSGGRPILLSFQVHLVAAGAARCGALPRLPERVSFRLDGVECK